MNAIRRSTASMLSFTAWDGKSVGKVYRRRTHVFNLDDCLGYMEGHRDWISTLYVRQLLHKGLREIDSFFESIFLRR